MPRQKQPDEVFCRSCGETIKQAAELCPHCGVRNRKKTSQATGGDSAGSSARHDPAQYTTTVSANWWYGVAAGIGLWILVLALTSALPSDSAFAGFLVLLAWVGLPVSVYFDMQYVRANGNWNPSSFLWVALLSIWLVNVFAGAAYLYRRHEVLGEP